MNAAEQQVQALESSLAELRAGLRRVPAWTAQARDCAALLAALPPRFQEVWLGLIDRLESAALFSEESCSFSQTDLLDSLQMWLDKARARLAG